MLFLGGYNEEEEKKKEPTKEELEKRTEDRVFEDIYDSIVYNDLKAFKRDLSKKNVNCLFGDYFWIHHCVGHERMEMVKYIIEELHGYISSTSLNMMKDDETALHIAAKNGQVDMVKYLLSKGINKTKKNCEGKLAEEICDEEISKIIKDFVYSEED